MGLISNTVLVVLFAWVVRPLLNAREVTWPRLLLAVVAGTAVGAAVAALMVIDVTAPIEGQLAEFEARRGELFTLALPFQVLATMLGVVVLELLWARPPRRTGWRRPIRSMRRSLGLVARGWQAVRIVTRHGLAPALGLKRGTVDTRTPEELARRARVALEDAGGNGNVGYRCPAEPVGDYLAKGGDITDTTGRQCLCNGLVATIGLGQTRANGYREPALLTAGDDLTDLDRFLPPDAADYSARNVIDHLTTPR